MPRLHPTHLLRLPTTLRRRARRSRLALMLLLLTILITLLAPLYIIYRPSQLLIRYFAHRWPDVLWYVDLPVDPITGKQPKVIALTIDDAPSTYTREILDLLSAEGASATFFVIGSQAEEAGGAEMLKEVVVRGNELGNHAMHDEPSRRLSSEELIEQIRRVDGIIERAYADANTNLDTAGSDDSRPKYFRPGLRLLQHAPALTPSQTRPHTGPGQRVSARRAAAIPMAQCETHSE